MPSDKADPSYSETRYSRLEAALEDDTAFSDWDDARKRLWRFMDTETIIVGHFMVRELRALGMVHTSVIDTSLLARRMTGKILKNSKILFKDILKVWLGEGNDLFQHLHTDGLPRCVEEAFPIRQIVIWCMDYPQELSLWAHTRRNKAS